MKQKTVDCPFCKKWSFLTGIKDFSMKLRGLKEGKKWFKYQWVCPEGHDYKNIVRPPKYVLKIAKLEALESKKIIKQIKSMYMNQTDTRIKASNKNKYSKTKIKSIKNK